MPFNLSIEAAVWSMIWLLCSIFVPDQLPLDTWKVTAFRPLVIFLAIIFSPIALLAAWLTRLFRLIVDRKAMLANREKFKRLNALVFESGRGAFDSKGSNENDALIKIKEILIAALDRRASDIFIDPNPDGSVRIRVRANGSLCQIEELPSASGKNMVNALKVVASMDISEHRQGQDGAFSVNFEGNLISFRVASVGAYGGEKISLRVLGSTSGPRTLDDLGLLPEELQMLKKAVGLPSGLVLMCGPTGSGKTSTLYAMLQTIDFSLKNVISIEDPIENIIRNVSQIEVNNKAGVTFASLLRNSLRQNPDILCVGEIRDAETAGIAIQAAQTGHLIIATVHSNDNLGTIDRLQTLGIPLRTVASALHIIVSQRLVRVLCPHCKTPVPIPPEYHDFFRNAGWSTEKIYSAGGCSECDYTGYAGRRAIFDILVLDSEMREMLENEHTTMASVQTFLEGRYGTNVLAYKALNLVAQGVTSLDEANRVTFDLG